jgi:rod shape-determining protein MreC
MFRKGVNRRLMGLVAVAILLLLLNSFGFLKPATNVLAAISVPAERLFGGWGAGAGGFFDTLGRVNQLSAENQRLKSQVADLQQKLSSDTELAAQNAELRKQLNLGDIRPESLIAAEVLSYQPDNFRQFLTIGRGSKDGIQTGMAVVSQGSLVGIVKDVAPTTAKVFLVVDPNFKVAAIDQSQDSRPSGTIHGVLGGGLVMDKIAQNENIKTGDTIITSGLGGDVTKGIIIGRVQSVDRRDNGVFQSAEVSTDIPFQRLEIVYAVTRP